MKRKRKAITKQDLQEFIEQGYSIRDLAKEYNVQIRTIQHYLEKFTLKTIYSNRKAKKQKVHMELAKDFNDSLWLDFTELTVRSGKHKASSKILALTVFVKQKRLAYIMEVKDKTKVMSIVSKLVRKYQPKQILADKEFYFLNDLIPTRKARTWNCSKQYNEKVHGLKNKIYQFLQYRKEQLNMSYEDLLNNKLMVLNAYIEILLRHGFEITIVDKITINQTQITSKPIIQ